MNKIYFFLIVFTITAGSVNAQKDDAAKKILDAVKAKVKTYKGINAGFTLLSKTRTGKINSHVNGNISVKGSKYYIKDGGQEIFSDGNKIWNYNGDDEVTVTDADTDDNSLAPQKLLTDFYDKDFTYKLISSIGSFNEIKLTPIDKRKNFKQVNVFVDKSKMMITRARIIDKSNNTIELNLKNINTRSDIPDETFVFNQKKYKKNIEVIE